jgi:predicted PolB exonuclease-like 3'-5' exonuclease
MLQIADFSKILFLDIETVRGHRTFEALPEEWQQLWDGKTRFQRPEAQSAKDFYLERGGVMAEFGKIVCISVGFIHQGQSGRTFRVKSFYGDDEKEILRDFSALLERHFNTPMHKLCAHNGKEFDFPWIARRLIINGMPIPSLLNMSGKKPWEVSHLDTMELWKFGDWKNYTSLKLLTACLGIPSPKDDIDGSQVGVVYYEERDVARIARYCQKDTLAVAQVLLRLCGQPLISPEELQEEQV